MGRHERSLSHSLQHLCSVVVKSEACHFSMCHLMTLSLIFMTKEISCDLYHSGETAFSLPFTESKKSKSFSSAFVDLDQNISPALLQNDFSPDS